MPLKDFNGSTSENVFTPETSMNNIFATGGTICAWEFARSNGGIDFGNLMTKFVAEAGWLLRFRSSLDGRMALGAEWSGTDIQSEYDGGDHLFNVKYLNMVTYDGSSTVNLPIFYLNNSVIPSGLITGPPTGTLNPETVNLGIGTRTDSSTVHWDGAILHCCLWNRILSENERTALSNGVNPFAINEGLVFYAPLWGDNPTPAYIPNIVGTNVGTSTIRDGFPVELLENYL